MCMCTCIIHTCMCQGVEGQRVESTRTGMTTVLYVVSGCENSEFSGYLGNWKKMQINLSRSMEEPIKD